MVTTAKTLCFKPRRPLALARCMYVRRLAVCTPALAL
jgi:hypothetical protein